MSRNRRLQQIGILMLALLIVLACNGGMVPATLTPVPTKTHAPTQTAMPRPTRTPSPTATLEPTSAPVGVPVSSALYEVKVLKARRLDNGVHIGNGYYWDANPGYIFVELGVRVRNLRPASTAVVPWQDVYVVEDSDDTWYPNWAGFTAVESGKEVDPSNVSVTDEEGDDLVKFSGDAYLRVIYIVTEKNPTTLLFGFSDSPLIEIVIQK